MNTRHWLMIVGLAGAVAFPSPAAGADPLDGIKYPIIGSATTRAQDISVPPTLCLIDGELEFLELHYTAAGKPVQESLPSISLGGGEMQTRLVREGSMLRIALTDKKFQSKAQLAKDGWYLTADFKGSPPQVILTKDPTKYSRWTFIREEVDRGRHHIFYIKTESDSGKDAWLTVGKDGVRYKGGREVYKPILSFDDRRPFDVGDYADGR